MNKMIVAAIAAVISAAVLIWVIQTGMSLLLLLAGFFLFILPVTFVSLLKSPLRIFLVIFYSIIVIYCLISWKWYDAFMGIFLALIIGGILAYLEVNSFMPFSKEAYKKDAKNEKKDGV